MVAKQIFKISLIAGTIGLIGLGAANAQTPAPAAGPVAKPATLTPAAMETQGGAIVSNIKAVQSAANQALTDARSKKDVTLTLCVNNIVNQVNAEESQATSRLSKLKAAVQSGDSAGASSDFTILTIRGNTVSKLSSDLSLCIGKDAGAVGASSTTSTGKKKGGGGSGGGATAGGGANFPYATATK